jgi:hypothetical protein
LVNGFITANNWPRFIHKVWSVVYLVVVFVFSLVYCTRGLSIRFCRKKTSGRSGDDFKMLPPFLFTFFNPMPRRPSKIGESFKLPWLVSGSLRVHSSAKSFYFTFLNLWSSPNRSYARALPVLPFSQHTFNLNSER